MRDDEGGVGFNVVDTHEKAERMMLMSDGYRAAVNGGVWMVPD